MKIHPALRTVFLKENSAGRIVTVHTDLFRQVYYMQINQHEDEVRIDPFILILSRGRRI